MTIRSHFRLLGVVGAVALSVAFSPQPAFARSQAGGASYIAGPSQMACFTPWYGTLTESFCGGVSVDFPLVVDNGGSKSVAVTVYAPTFGAISCRATGTDPQVQQLFFSAGGAYVGNQLVGISTISIPSGAYVPSGGQLVLNCGMGQNTTVKTIAWNP